MPKSEKTIIRFFMICHTCTQTEHPRIFMILGGFQFLSYVLSGKQYFECFSVFSYLVEHSNLQFLLYVLDGKAFSIWAILEVLGGSSKMLQNKVFLQKQNNQKTTRIYTTFDASGCPKWNQKCIFFTSKIRDIYKA